MKKIALVIITCFIGAYAFGQSISSSVISTAGESVENGSVNVSWTLGEIAVETFDDNGNVILTQGFQQGYFEVVSIGDPVTNNFELKIYPNPATEFIWIDLKSTEINSSIIEVYSMEGKLVKNEKWEFELGPKQLMLDNLNNAQYIVRVSDSNGKVLQTFKLIKR